MRLNAFLGICWLSKCQRVLGRESAKPTRWFTNFQKNYEPQKKLTHSFQYEPEKKSHHLFQQSRWIPATEYHNNAHQITMVSYPKKSCAESQQADKHATHSALHGFWTHKTTASLEKATHDKSIQMFIDSMTLWIYDNQSSFRVPSKCCSCTQIRLTSHP